jgi:hypothetical protein
MPRTRVSRGIAAADSVRASSAPAAEGAPVPAPAGTPASTPDFSAFLGMFDALRASVGSLHSRVASAEMAARNVATSARTMEEVASEHELRSPSPSPPPRARSRRRLSDGRASSEEQHDQLDASSDAGSSSPYLGSERDGEPYELSARVIQWMYAPRPVPKAPSLFDCRLAPQRRKELRKQYPAPANVSYCLRDNTRALPAPARSKVETDRAFEKRTGPWVEVLRPLLCALQDSNTLSRDELLDAIQASAHFALDQFTCPLAGANETGPYGSPTGGGRRQLYGQGRQQPGGEIPGLRPGVGAGLIAAVHSIRRGD